MMKLATVAAAIALLALAGQAGASSPTSSQKVRAAKTGALRTTTRKWEAVMGVAGRAHTRFSIGSPASYRFWRHRARAVERVANHPPHKSGWLCIHRFEGSWSDANDPYWGGLQMDRGFMRTYAPSVLLRRGWANRWTPLEQMWVAERAHRSGRGYSPWPNTARDCGLL